LGPHPAGSSGIRKFVPYAAGRLAFLHALPGLFPFLGNAGTGWSAPVTVHEDGAGFAPHAFVGIPLSEPEEPPLLDVLLELLPLEEVVEPVLDPLLVLLVAPLLVLPLAPVPELVAPLLVPADPSLPPDEPLPVVAVPPPSGVPPASPVDALVAHPTARITRSVSIERCATARVRRVIGPKVMGRWTSGSEKSHESPGLFDEPRRRTNPVLRAHSVA
jgi:hypothetical protein